VLEKEMTVPTRQSLPVLQTQKGTTAPAIPWKKIVLVVVVSLFVIIDMMIVSDYSNSFLTPPNAWNPLRTRSTEPAFSLLVTLQFSAEEYKDQFFKDIQPLADYCKAHEPDTIAYEVLHSDKDPLQALILERYRNKETAFLQVHRSSAPFQAFRPKLKAMEDEGRVKISGDSYVDSGIGFGDRS
jgi:quinol monooxygenase YgiN